MEEIVIYFEKIENLESLKAFIERLKNISSDEFYNTRNQHIITIFTVMITEPVTFDEKCQVSLKQIGAAFFNRLSRQDVELSVEFLDLIFADCIRFINELYLSMDSNLSGELEAPRIFARTRLSEFTDFSRNELSFAFFELPISIFKTISRNPSIKSFAEFNKLAQQASDQRNQWERELSLREKRVSDLKTSLNKFETEFNFIGLFDGFNTLSVEKALEKKNLLFWLKIFGVLTLTPLACEFFLMWKIEKFDTTILFTAIPAASATAIMIYFFRIILQNYKSVKSQILQIELRKTLCRFIQSYSEFSSDLKSKDKEALAKFENIIFSGIVSDDERLPSTFDGIEQISSIIKAIKA